MAAPKNNKFYQLVKAQTGRPREFKSPNEIWEDACTYFNWVDEHPWIKNESIKGGDLAGTTMAVDLQRPYLLSALCLVLGVDQRTFNNYGSKEGREEFFPVVKQIKEIIYTQKFEGAAVGAFNQLIIARDLGLSEKVDNTSSDGTMTPAKSINLEYNGKEIDLGID